MHYAKPPCSPSGVSIQWLVSRRRSRINTVARPCGILTRFPILLEPEVRGTRSRYEIRKSSSYDPEASTSAQPASIVASAGTLAYCGPVASSRFCFRRHGMTRLIVIDHDRLFKELFSTFFVEFLDLFVPEALAYVEEGSVEFLDKEIFTDVTSGERH